MTSNVRQLYDLAKNKNGLIKALAKEFNRRKASVRSAWIYREEYPEKDEAKIIEFMQAWIRNENKVEV